MKITDIWFKTSLPLKSIGEIFGYNDIKVEGENYWEWIIVNLEGIALNITRSNTVPPKETDTRVFAYGPPAFSQKNIAYITGKLQRQGISPIYVGHWNYLHGNEFNKKVDQEII